MRSLLLMFFLFVAQVALAQIGECTLENLGKLDMLLLEVNTVDSVMPTCDFVDHPAGAFGHSITNANKVPARLVITLLGDTLYDSGDYEAGVSGISIKINGNTSARKNPKPYKIKLQEKADLLFRDNPDFIDKDWRLIRDDRTLNSVVGFKLNELMGMQWTPQYAFCNLFLNGEYQGNYLLIENVKRNTSARIDVSKKGYIVERDAYWWNEDLSFKTNFFNDNRYGWTFKYPEADEVTVAQQDYIRNYLCETENAINRGDYEDYIDVESFASWVLAHDILGTWDSGGSNLYITKYDNTSSSKLVMGNLWDFDSSHNVGETSFSRYHSGADFYFEKLFYNSNDLFRQVYIAKWADIKGNLAAVMSDFLTDFVSTYGTTLNLARRYFDSVYGTNFVSISSNASIQKSWFNKHLPWLEQQICGPIIVTPVTDVEVESHTPLKTYNLQGIEVPAGTPGLVIRGGKLIKQ